MPKQPLYGSVGAEALAKGHMAMDHDWLWLPLKERFKCVMCGALTQQLPPRPTPNDWMPERYETLTDDERSLRDLSTGNR